MSAYQKMRSALRKYVISQLLDVGFTGKYPHYRRVLADRIELLTFQWNKCGNSFTVEVSVLFTQKQGLAANFTSDTPEVSFENATTYYTNRRLRLKGMFDGWFYYTDVYCTKFKTGLKTHKIYHDVGEDKAQSYVPNQNEYLVQKADDDVYIKICDTVNKQMKSARRWWKKMSKYA